MLISYRLSWCEVIIKHLTVIVWHRKESYFLQLVYISKVHGSNKNVEQVWSNKQPYWGIKWQNNSNITVVLCRSELTSTTWSTLFFQWLREKSLNWENLQNKIREMYHYYLFIVIVKSVNVIFSITKLLLGLRIHLLYGSVCIMDKLCPGLSAF